MATNMLGDKAIREALKTAAGDKPNTVNDGGG